jgi:hypothetical protein
MAGGRAQTSLARVLDGTPGIDPQGWEARGLRHGPIQVAQGTQSDRRRWAMDAPDGS